MSTQAKTEESIHTDPVCRMQVSGESELKADFNGKTYFFCSSHCRKAFRENPESYLSNKGMEASGMQPAHSGELSPSNDQSPLSTYFPLILILAYLLGVLAIVELRTGSLNPMRIMNHFMGGFFLIFSFFKLLDLPGFAEAYRTYDWVAKRFPFYGRIYPFIELALGLAYIAQTHLWITHLMTLVVMSVSSFGVLQSLLKKSRFQCACLGTVFKLPMTQVTLFEDLLMAGMAAVGLFFS